MAFILKSAKLIPNLIECSCQRIVPGRGKNVFSSNFLRSSVIKKVAVRTNVSLAAEEQRNSPDLERTLLRLNDDIRRKNVFLGNAREILDIIKQRGEITEPQTMLLLKCCSEVSFINSEKDRLQFAQEVWKTAESLGTQFSINHYNALLSVFLENNHEFSPTEFLSTLGEKGVEPNLVTHRRILKAFCQRGDVQGASKTLEKMKELNFPLSEEDFNALIQCHCEVGELEKANEILKLMENREVEPTPKTYLNLLCGYAKHGMINSMMKILENLPEKNAYLSCDDLLEIVYVLAIHNHSEHIDTILEKLWKDYEFSGNTKLIIQRLLHKKMDSVALEIFENLEVKGKALDYILAHSKHILRHFALYRSPQEILKIYNNLEEKGLAKASFGYILREILLHKDEHFCLNFFRAMMQCNMTIRSHYFWPAIIKASRKGNKAMLHTVEFMPQRLLTNCQYTTTKIIFPNYKFSNDWLADREVLLKAGVPAKWLSVCFLKKLVMEKKMEEVEYLASSFPVDIELSRSILNELIDFVQSHPDQVDCFVNIIYYLSHDHHLKYLNALKNDESSRNVETRNFFDVCISVFVKNLRDDRIFEEVLKKMLERKFGISTKTASKISESAQVGNLADLAEELSGLGPQLVYDDEIIKLKSEISPKHGREARLKRFGKNEEINVEELHNELEREGSFFKSIFTIRNLVMIERYEEALQLTKVLANQKEKNENSRKNLYLSIICDLCSRDQFDFAEKAFNLGTDLAILDVNDYVSYLRFLFSRGQTSLAVEKYCNYLENTKTSAKSLEFLKKVIASGSEEDLRRLTCMMPGILGKDLFMTQLVIAFFECGDINMAKKILETKKFKFLERRFYSHCKIKAKQSSSKELQNYIKLVKEVESFDRIPLYELILKKYAEEENVKEVKQLWLLIEEDDISDYYFLEQIRELMDDPSLERLKDIANRLQEVDKSPKRAKKYSLLNKELRH